MSRRATALSPILLTLAIAGCGGSTAHSSSSATTASPGATSTPASTQTQATTGQTTGPTTSTGQTTTRPTTRPATTGTTTGGQTTTGDGNGGAAITGSGSRPSSGGRPKPQPTGGAPANVRVPATYAVTSSERLSPPSISAPSELPIELTVESRDGRAHRVTIRLRRTYRLKLAANGTAAVLIPGQQKGHYVLKVDGTPRGVLLVGAQPGP